MRLKGNPLDSFRYCPRCGQADFANHGDRAKLCHACGLRYFHNVASAVACLLRNKDGKYLFVRRGQAPARGTLDLPGGFVDPLETVEDAVRRELREETGLEAGAISYLRSLPNIYPFSGIDVYTSDLFFLVDCDSFEGAKASDDASELCICSLIDIKAEDFGLMSIRKFMQDLLG